MTSPQNNPQSPTNGEEKMRESEYLKDKRGLLSYVNPDDREMLSGAMDAFVQRTITAHHLALLEQLIVENEERKFDVVARQKEIGSTSKTTRRKLTTSMVAHNSALDLINTDLRAKIKELKKEV